MLAQLGAGLVRSGHRSFVLACEGSKTSGVLINGPKPPKLLDGPARSEVSARYRLILDAFLAAQPADVIHFHGLDFDKYLPSTTDATVLATLHLPPQWYPPDVFKLKRPWTFLNCVSDSQLAACPRCGYMLTQIDNGVPEPAQRTTHARRQFVMALGRVCPEKGFHLALEAARRARVPMLLAGEVFGYPDHVEYFRREIEPRLDRGRPFCWAFGRQTKAAPALRGPMFAGFEHGAGNQFACGDGSA